MDGPMKSPMKNGRLRRNATKWFTPFVLACVLATDTAAAETDGPPRYCDAAALRVDASLCAVDFRDPQLGLAVGCHGAICRSEDGGKTWQLMESTVPFQLDDVLWLDDSRAVAAGGAYDPITGISRGVVVFSNDGGRRWWRAADQELPRIRSLRMRADDGALLAAGDWSAVSLQREYESRDGGRTWRSSGELDGAPTFKAEPSSQDLLAWVKATRLPVAIRDAVRTSSGDVWAVGDHGVILRRRNEQDSWEVSRGGGNQTAVLMVSKQATTVAWPLLGREALESRHRVALLMVQQQTPRSFDSTSSALDLVRQAAAAVGVSAVDREAAPSSEALRERAADWMAIHRPAAVVIDQSLAQPVQAAFAEAAISFGAQRVIVYSFGSRGNLMLHRAAMLPRTGVLASDLWRDAFQLLAPEDTRVHSISLRSLYEAGNSKVRGDSVASSLRLTRGQMLDAETESATRRQLQILQARLNHLKQIESLIQNSHDKDVFADGLKGLLDQTAKSDRQRLAWSVYQKLANADPMPADVAGFNEAILAELQSRFANSSLAWFAQLRSQSIRKSEEWRRLRAVSGFIAAHPQIQMASAEVVPVSPFQVETPGIVQASAIVPLKIVDTTPVDATPETIQADFVDLNWEFHPLALVTREAARRRGDDQQLQAPDGVSANLRRLLAADEGAWTRLLRRQGPAVIAAHATPTPPKLDASLDDECWQSTMPPARAPWHVGCAYDEQFLYLAIVTPAEVFRDDADLPHSDQVRDRDLTVVDRVEVSIDTDLDLLTAFQFEFSRGGRTHDAIDGYPQWQPTWYVACKQAGEWVITEMAVNRRDLVDLPIVPGQSWFVKTRTIAAGDPTFFQCMPRPSDWKRIVFH